MSRPMLWRYERMAVSMGYSVIAGVDEVGMGPLAGAVAGLKIPAEYLLVDAWDVPEAPLPQMAVVRGDRTCASIMAASIVAKVARDKAMVEYDRLYPGYGFADHKGYATPAHRAAIRRRPTAKTRLRGRRNRLSRTPRRAGPGLPPRQRSGRGRGQDTNRRFVRN